MEPVVLFDATILVFWAVAFVPYALREQKKYLVIVTVVPIFAVDMYLAREMHPLDKNILTSLFAVTLAFTGGLVQHHYNQKRERENERTE